MRRRFAHRNNGAYRLRHRHPRRAQPRLAHPAEDPIDRGLVDITQTTRPDLGGEPLPVHAPVVRDRALLPPLLGHQVLGQEALDRLVDGDVPVATRSGSGALRTSPANSARSVAASASGGRLNRAVQTPGRPVVPSPDGNGELPDPRPDLALGAGAPWCSLAADPRASSPGLRALEPTGGRPEHKPGRRARRRPERPRAADHARAPRPRGGRSWASRWRLIRPDPSA